MSTISLKLLPILETKKHVVTSNVVLHVNANKELFNAIQNLKPEKLNHVLLSYLSCGNEKNMGFATLDACYTSLTQLNSKTITAVDLSNYNVNDKWSLATWYYLKTLNNTLVVLWWEFEDIS